MPCSRNRSDCIELSCIKSSCGKSFVCSGINDGRTRTVERDDCRLCVVGPHQDLMVDIDGADAAAMSSCLSAVTFAKLVKLEED